MLELMKRTLVLLALPLLALGNDEAGMDAGRLAKIAPRMKAFVDQGTAAGFVTLIARHGHLAHLEAVGYQDLETKIPMRTDSIFQIMSMTKPVTCTGAMILMEEGRLSLIDPVEKYLPEFKGQQVNVEGALHKPSRPINIRDLMTHTSGMAVGHAKELEGTSRHTLAEVVSADARLPLNFEPGAKWSYSNTGLATLGRIIEVVSGEPYEQFILQRILQPLGMKDTFYFPPAEKLSRIASPYTDVNGRLERAKDDLSKKGAKYPGPEGGLYSTATDLARFYQMMLNKGTLDRQHILSRAGVEVMTQNQTGDLKAGFAPGFGYGLGWGVIKDASGTFRLNSIGTFGHGGGYRTYGWMDPAKDMLGVILYQRTNGGGDIADETNVFMAMAAAAIEK
jgi:CubicO group peptidase (beta-lactamase class C family)